MGGGADISKEAGDVVLTRSSLKLLVDLYELSMLTRRKAL